MLIFGVDYIECIETNYSVSCIRKSSLLFSKEFDKIRLLGLGEEIGRVC